MGLLESIFYTYLDASAYLLIGIILSGIIHALCDARVITRHLGQKTVRSVFWAALAGVPLPLCSCGVIPMAAQLRKQGASAGAVVAFLISTPETGIDSISLSFAFLDPLLAIIRPVAAFCSGLIAGIIVNRLNPDNLKESQQVPEAAVVVIDWGQRLRESFYQSAVVLLGSIGLWMIVGIVLAGIIGHVFPVNFFEQWLAGGLGSMVLVLVVALPLYVCASASTPIAASLILKGASPGVALVFLLAGPATNIATMLVVLRTLGAKVLMVYLMVIVSLAVGVGLLVDYVCLITQYDVRQIMLAQEHRSGPWHFIASGVFSLLLAHALWYRYCKD